MPSWSPSVSAYVPQPSENAVKIEARRKAGDLLEITLGPRVVEVTVLGVMARRGPAAEAQRHYQETPLSVERGRRLAEQRRLAASAPRPPGRPDKHDRRELMRLQRAQGDTDPAGGCRDGDDD